MKIKEITAKFNINGNTFERFVKKNNLPYSENFLGDMIIDDNVVLDYVRRYKEAAVVAAEKLKEEQALAAEKLKEEQALAAEKLKELDEKIKLKKKAMAEMLITSGFSFDGYTITKYSGYISGDDAISVDRGLAIFGTGINVKDKLMESLVKIRRNALRELKEAAYDLGCNAVIGVDFDYLTLDPQTANLGGGTTYQPYIFGVTANGNAVVIEKNKKEE